MAVTSQVAEKRAAPRIQRTRDFLWQMNLGDDRLITQNITNISRKGLAFKAPSSTDIAEGEIVRFTLSLNREKSFECEGRVMWVKDSKDRQGAMKQFGVLFLVLPPSLNAVIVESLEKSDARQSSVVFKQIPGQKASQKLVRGKLTLRSVWLTVIGGFLIIAFTAAFVTAIWLHDQTHSNNSVAKKSRIHDDVRKISSSPDPLLK